MHKLFIARSVKSALFRIRNQQKPQFAAFSTSLLFDDTQKQVNFKIIIFFCYAYEWTESVLEFEFYEFNFLILVNFYVLIYVFRWKYWV